MKKCLKIFLCLLLSFVLAFGSTISVFASDLNDGENDGYDRFMGGTNIEGFNHWDTTSKKSFWLENFATFCAKIGLVIKTGNVDGLYESHINYLIENERIADADSYDEFIASHLSANEEETELYMSNDLSNTLYNASVQYIEEETRWYVAYTFKPSQMLTKLTNQSQYETLVNLCSDLASDEVLIFEMSKSYNGSYYPFYMVAKVDGFLFNKNQWTGFMHCYGYYKWDRACNSVQSSGYILTDGTVDSLDGTDFSYVYSNSNSLLCTDLTGSAPSTNYLYYLRSNNTPFRVYKTLDDYKAYSVGERPYYVTDAFTNYDSTVDNSTTITQTEIDNSVTYGDVYNYITNNYENPDGLSEDELRAILAEYLSQINNNNSGGGSGGSGDSGGSGGGLSGFLDGLGSIGNAILAILGKLMEILGSAIELISGSIMDLITIIPNSIGELLGALFPVFPEEWIKAITLSLVLGVIVGIVRIFK